MTQARRPLIALGLIAAVEGAGLVGYALFEAVGAVLVGTNGPVEVSNPTALVMQIVIFAVLGAGMLAVAWAWRGPAGWVRGPFVLAQVIAVAIGVEAVGGGGIQRVIAVVAILLAAAGLVLTFTPSVVHAVTHRP